MEWGSAVHFPGYPWLVASTRGKALTVRQSLQCGMRHILYRITRCQSVSQFLLWVRCYRLEAVNNHWRDPSQRVIVRHFALPNKWILASNDPALDTTETENVLEMKREAEGRILHRMAKVHDLLEMFQGSQNLSATPKESPSQNMQMTAVGYISSTEWIVEASWSNFHYDVAAAFKLLERSPLPPALSAKDLPGGRTQGRYVHWIKRNDSHPAESDEHGAPNTIWDTQYWLNWNGQLEN